MSRYKAHERIAVAPFLDWFDGRVAMLHRENNAHPLITQGVPFDALARAVSDLGWERDAGERRIYRWRQVDSVVRYAVEDALDHAGGLFGVVYPDAPVSTGPNDMGRIGVGRYMTDAQVRAAHVLYERTGQSLAQLGELLYKRLGYYSALSCTSALNRAFVHMDLPRRDALEATRATHTTHGLTVGHVQSPEYQALRLARKHERLGDCQHQRKNGKPCPYCALPGTTTCGYHRPEELARRRAQIQKINAGRVTA